MSPVRVFQVIGGVAVEQYDPLPACSDCGLSDGPVIAGRCRWCAELAELRAAAPPPNPGRRVRS